ncbi:MAG: hypothetical protein SOY43_08065 [Parabacteroides sp.]|nr:hypothetical protein [bacterium]MDY4102818.1 hypothetical protein [Parabacteroides sp.]
MRYLQRKIDGFLQEWKMEPDRKPLLVRGARQVGKSCAVRRFGESFEYYLEVNFERDRDVADISTAYRWGRKRIVSSSNTC